MERPQISFTRSKMEIADDRASSSSSSSSSSSFEATLREAYSYKKSDVQAWLSRLDSLCQQQLEMLVTGGITNVGE